jgi:pimeloyl-ACP methyl ester carboxylesterase
MKRYLLACLVLFTAACEAVSSATATLPAPRVNVVTSTPLPPSPTSAPTANPRGTPLPAATPAEPSAITIAAPDGAALAASYYPPALSPQAGAQSAAGVVLLHMLGLDRSSWDAFARELQKYGIAVVTLDLRGHGGTSAPADWAKAPGDVRAAWDELVKHPEVNPKATALAGASIGANLALIAGANNVQVGAVAALSPGLDYRGVQPAAVLPNFGQRPVFFIASEGDSYSYTSVKQFVLQTPQGETHYFTGAAHGTDMFAAAPELTELLLDWLIEKLGILKG